MQRLRGKTILIGKNPQQNNLLIAVKGLPKTGMVGAPQSVPNSVSRCIPFDGVGHASIDIDHNGSMTISNLKRLNVTYVNGSQIESKRIDGSSTIELGRDRYPVNTAMVLEAAKKIVSLQAPIPQTPQTPQTPHMHGSPMPPRQQHPQQPYPNMPGGGGAGIPRPASNGGVVIGPDGKKKYKIAHLGTIYTEYHDFLKKLNEKQRMRANLQRVPMFFTMGSGVLSSLAVALEWDVTVRYLCFGLTMLGLILSIVFFMMSKNDKTMDEKEIAAEQFQDRYVCPSCGKFLGNQSYRLLKRQYSMHCPYCKCEYVE